MTKLGGCVIITTKSRLLPTFLLATFTEHPTRTTAPITSINGITPRVSSRKTQNSSEIGYNTSTFPIKNTEERFNSNSYIVQYCAWAHFITQRQKF